MKITDFLDFVIFPILVLTYGSVLTFFARVNRKLNDHETALAILIQQVNPPGDKSLRSLIQEIQLEQARHSVPIIPPIPHA